MSYRDQKTKEAFIKYLQKNTEERFFQALTNFTGMPYIGVAATPAGDNFKDLWHTEADKVLVHYSRKSTQTSNRKSKRISKTNFTVSINQIL